MNNIARIITAVIAVLVVAVTTNGAKAGTVALQNNFSFDNTGFVLRDGNSGTEWLNLTKTVNRSYNDISSKFGSGQEFEGWRYASGAQVNTLLSGWTSLSITGTGLKIYSDTAIDGLVPYLGNTYQHSLQAAGVSLYDDTPSDHNYTYGMTSDEHSYEAKYLALIFDTSEANLTATDYSNIRYSNTSRIQVASATGGSMPKNT